MALKLKKGLRLSHQVRDDIARSVIADRMGEQITTINELEGKLALELIDTFAEQLCTTPGSLDLSWRQLPEGFLPRVEEVSVKNGDAEATLRLPEVTPVPYHFLRLDGSVLTALNDELVTQRVTDFLQQRDSLLDRRSSAEKAIFEHLTKFRNPYDLLKSSPEFGEYLPESFYEEDNATTTSIDDLIAA